MYALLNPIPRERVAVPFDVDHHRAPVLLGWTVRALFSMRLVAGVSARSVRRQAVVRAPRTQSHRSRGPRWQRPKSKHGQCAPAQGRGPFACVRSRKLCALAALIVVTFGCAALVSKSGAIITCEWPGCIDGAAFTSPRDIYVDPADGDHAYVADYGNCAVQTSVFRSPVADSLQASCVLT